MQQIIAMGGGGFSMEPDNLALDQYILKQARQPIPAVCFLPTASGDADGYCLGFYKAFSKMDCRPSTLSLFRLPSADLESFVMEKDVIYVGGGNTRSMLALWREWGLDIILRKACEAGVVLAGISAGGNCWFEECSTDSAPGELQPLACLGYLPGSFCPHYDEEAERRPSYHKMIFEGRLKPGYAADNSAAVHFINGKLHQAVRSVATAHVYRVYPEAGQVREEALAMVDLEKV